MGHSARGKALTLDELHQQTPIYLVRITFAGLDYRFSTRTISIPSDDGDDVLHLGQLEQVDFPDEVDLFVTVPPIRKLALEVRLPFDVAQAIERNHSIDLIEGELAVWVEGRTFEERYVLIEGLAEEPQYRRNDTIELTLVDTPWNVPTLYPDPDAVIDETTWANPQADSVGVPYPTPFGNPGRYTLATTGEIARVPGSRAYLVDTAGTADVPYALLFGDGSCALNEITVIDADGAYIAPNLTPVYTRDLKGRLVSVVQLTSAQAGSPDFNREFFVRTGGALTNNGYGILGDNFDTDGTDRLPISGAGDVLTAALRRSRRNVDWGAVEALRPKLNRFRFDTVWEERLDPFEWVQENLLSLLPFALGGGPGGLRPIFFDPSSWKEQAQFHFIAGLDGELLGEPIYERGQVENRILIDWALHRGRNTWQRQAITVEAAEDLDRDIPSAYVRWSQAQYGIREKAIQAAAIYDEATAQLVALARLRALALGYRKPTYVAPPKWLAFQAGTIGLLTDPEKHWEERPVMLRAIAWGRSQARLEFVVPDDPEKKRTTA